MATHNIGTDSTWFEWLYNYMLCLLNRRDSDHDNSQQNIPITTEMAMTIANSSNFSKYLCIFYLQIIMIFKQFIYYIEEFEIVLDCFAVFAYYIYMFRFKTVLTHTLALTFVS
jgi:hypothetical protein